MPSPLCKPADLGCVRRREGVCYAEVFARDLKEHFTGPRRGQDKQRASEDLAAIRAAATDHATRAEAIDAMKRKADELKKDAKAERRGGTEVAKGGHRTRVRFIDSSGARKAVVGPIRPDERLARADAVVLHEGASASSTTRAELVEATQKEPHHPQQPTAFDGMKRKADELKKQAKAKRCGGTEVAEGGHRTRTRYIDASGARKAIRGPIRYDERRAKADAEVLCEAAMASAASRAERFDGIANKAHDLKKHAATEAQVAIAVAKDQLDKKHLVTDSESEPEHAPACASDIWNEPCPDVDVSSREACERLANQLPPPPKKARKELPPATPVEATARLAKIRPPYTDLPTLRTLLEARADPRVNIENSPAGSALRRFTWFAPAMYVREMRNLLIAYGATETKEDKKAWKDRESYTRIEPAYLANFHRDDRMG